MKRSTRIINRSEWPTWLVRWLVRKAAADAKIAWPYEWTQRSTSRGWRGRGWNRAGWGSVFRRTIDSREATWLHKDYRFKSDDVFPIPHSPVAVLAFLIRHELEHANDGHPSKFRKESRVKRYDMEFICNATASEWVLGLREQWPAIRKEWLALARKERNKKRRDPEERTRRNHARRLALLATWERALKTASTKVKKYRRAVKAAETRMAAAQGAKRH